MVLPTGGSRRGLALSELLVALAVLLPVAVVTVGIFPYAHTIDRRAWALSQAEDVARSQLERLRASEWDKLRPSWSLREIREQREFQVEVRLADLPGVSPDLARRAEVTVTWRVRPNQDESVHLATILAHTDPGASLP